MSMDESTSEMSSEPPREVFHSIPKLKLLFITLEYKAGTFSGNGVYSQSIVRSLTQLGHSLFVIRFIGVAKNYVFQHLLVLKHHLLL